VFGGLRRCKWTNERLAIPARSVGLSLLDGDVGNCGQLDAGMDY
jgi:hypothetical protein